MGKGEGIMCSEHRLSLQGVLSGHPEAANPGPDEGEGRSHNISL